MSFNLDWVGAAGKFYEKHSPEVWVVTGVLLFAPSQLLAALGFVPLITQLRPWIILLFLLTTMVLLGRIIRWQSVRWKARMELAARRGRLHRLTPGEKAILRNYVAERTMTQSLPIGDGVVGGLEAEQVLYKGSQFSRDWGYWDYNIQPWAWTYLNEHPELLRAEGERASA